jgi:hypothetical protein
MLTKTDPDPDLDPLCANCGHEKSEHNPSCEAGAGCAGECPCKRFVHAS